MREEPRCDDCDDPMHWFPLVPPLRLALDPVLTPLDRVLDDATRFPAVKRYGPPPAPDPDRRAAVHPSGGSLRLLVVQHLSGWVTRRRRAGCAIFCASCRVDVAPVPDETTRRRGATRRQPTTRQRRLDQVVRLARSCRAPGAGSCGSMGRGGHLHSSPHRESGGMRAAGRGAGRWPRPRSP